MTRVTLLRNLGYTEVTWVSEKKAEQRRMRKREQQSSARDASHGVKKSLLSKRGRRQLFNLLPKLS